MTGKQLTAHNAVITTASVEIKTLTVSGRQVTQALFRQLREEKLIAEDGTLNGVPWGYVNYHPDKCGDHSDTHQHFVWQVGNELRRSRVNAVPDFVWNRDLREYGNETTDDFATAWVREACHHRANRAVLDSQKRRDEDERSLNEPVNKETKVPAVGVISQAAQSAIRSDRRVTAAYACAERPLTSYECGHWGAPRWSEVHSELADVAEKAIKLGVEISLKHGIDNDFDVHILAPHEAVELGKALRAEEHAILELLLSKRSDDFEALTNAINEHVKVLAALDAEVDNWGLSWPEIKAEYATVIRAEAARRERHLGVCATVSQLPQLFIAT